MTFKVQIDNYWVTYRLEGNPSHPVILFLHGFMGDRDEFQHAFTALSKLHYCVAIDLPNHGQTYVVDRVEGVNLSTYQDDYYTIQSTASFVIKFLDFLRIKKCCLVGYSMGGRLGLYLTIHFPQYFHKVILESASAGLRTIAERSDRLAKDRQLASDLESGDFEVFLENWYRQAIFGNLRSHPKFSQMLEQRLKNSPSQLANSLRNLSTGLQPSLWEKLSDCEIPLLLLVGELDTKFVQINRQIEQLCKFAQLEIVPQCSHNIHFEYPELFVERIQVFLQQPVYISRHLC